ncbi:MAG: thioredoxin-dependent thiol peroxidase, partial [Myxococcota bacterium]
EVRPAPEVGDMAPDFTLPADDGTEVSLESLRGKTVVLFFYPKDNTPGCTTEACNFRDINEELLEKDVQVIGVSRDSVKSHARFKDKQSLNFPLLSDPEGEMISAYGAWGPKVFMGRKFDGILRSTVIIDPEGRVAKVYPKVSVKTHADEVLADLEEMA